VVAVAKEEEREKEERGGNEAGRILWLSLYLSYVFVECHSFPPCDFLSPYQSVRGHFVLPPGTHLLAQEAPLHGAPDP